jgi:hypothetical protein
MRGRRIAWWLDNWGHILTALGIAALTGISLLTWRLLGGARWAKGLDEPHTKLVQCVRCERNVQLWNIDHKTPLPERTPEQKLEWLRQHPEALMREPPPHIVEYGCWHCSGKAKMYPYEWETRSQFLKRARLTEKR